MMPEPIAPPKPSASGGEKKKKAAASAPHPSVSFSQEIELLTNASAQQSQSQQQIQRRAMDYEPPASFLQTMDRPVRENARQTSPIAKGNVLADLWSFA